MDKTMARSSCASPYRCHCAVYKGRYLSVDYGPEIIRIQSRQVGLIFLLSKLRIFVTESDVRPEHPLLSAGNAPWG